MRRGRPRRLLPTWPLLFARACHTNAISVTNDGRVCLDNGRRLALSPSYISTFRQCPHLFKLRHIERLPEPATPQLAAGVLLHETLAKLFDLPPTERRLDTAQSLFRDLWRDVRQKPRYGELFGLQRKGDVPRDYHDVERERAWGLQAFEALRRYFALEDPQSLSPIGREHRVRGELSSRRKGEAAIPLAGIIDRLDDDGADGLVIVDYKTGRAPTAHQVERVAEAWFQLEMYALLLAMGGQTPRQIRLLYLGEGGAARERDVDDELLERVAASLRGIWEEMLEAIRTDTFEPSMGPLCNTCAHRDACPAMAATRAAAGAG